MRKPGTSPRSDQVRLYPPRKSFSCSTAFSPEIRLLEDLKLTLLLPKVASELYNTMLIAALSNTNLLSQRTAVPTEIKVYIVYILTATFKQCLSCLHEA